MLLFVLAFLGGILTIASPCVLPVLPFVFARADQPFVRSGLPTLVGMAVTFAGIATLAAIGGGRAVQANQYGRIAALVLLALFGVALLLPDLTTRITSPLVAIGSRITQISGGSGPAKNTVVPSLVLGVAIGLLWAPCAGPILGLILTGAALKGASAQTSLLLLSYAAGAATSLALALLVGGRVFAAMKRSLGVGEWIRRGLGVAVLLGVVVIAMGMDTGFLTRISLASTTTLEQALLDRFNMKTAANQTAAASDSATQTGSLPVEGFMPSLSGAVAWLNSPPLTTESLRGKVVLVDFWTYSCINCLRTIPYVEAWAQKYRVHGLVVIGVHSPEFAFEKNIDNVRKAIADLQITYPVAIDNDYEIWRAFNNQYWPADYFVDARGRIRDHQFGEGDYDQSERVIQQLLAEAGVRNVPAGLVSVNGAGAEAPADANDVESQETYVGYERAHNFASPGGAVQDTPRTYSVPTLALNNWAMSGNWTIGKEYAVLNEAGGAIVYRFHARDLHLVIGPGAQGKPVRFQVLLDGKPPGSDHGVDTESNGFGTVSAQRLYQLVRQHGNIADRTFEIRFLDPGVQAFAFTFG